VAAGWLSALWRGLQAAEEMSGRPSNRNRRCMNEWCIRLLSEERDRGSRPRFGEQTAEMEAGCGGEKEEEEKPLGNVRGRRRRMKCADRGSVTELTRRGRKGKAR
jgi:hypothetical protein